MSFKSGKEAGSAVTGGGMLGKEGREEGRERGEGGDSENGGSAGDRVVAGRGEGRSGGGGRGGRTLFGERSGSGRVVVVVMVYVGGAGRRRAMGEQDFQRLFGVPGGPDGITI